MDAFYTVQFCDAEGQNADLSVVCDTLHDAWVTAYKLRSDGTKRILRIIKVRNDGMYEIVKDFTAQEGEDT